MSNTALIVRMRNHANSLSVQRRLSILHNLGDDILVNLLYTLFYIVVQMGNNYMGVLRRPTTKS